MSTVIYTRVFSPNILEVLLGDNQRPICLLIEPEGSPGQWYFVPIEGALYSSELLAVIGRRLEELNIESASSTSSSIN
jgi:hypothetical protein